jgi:hypothetical protein
MKGGHQNDHQMIQQKLRVIISISTLNYDTYQCGDTTDGTTDDTAERTIYARINYCNYDSYNDVAHARETHEKLTRNARLNVYTKFTRITVCNHDSYQSGLHDRRTIAVRSP